MRLRPGLPVLALVKSVASARTPPCLRAGAEPRLAGPGACCQIAQRSGGPAGAEQGVTPHSGSEPWQDVRRVGFAARVDLDHALAQLFDLLPAAATEHVPLGSALGRTTAMVATAPASMPSCPDRADRRLRHRRGRQLRRQRIQPDPAAARSDRGDCGRAHASRHRCRAALWSGRRVRDRRGFGAGRRRDAGGRLHTRRGNGRARRRADRGARHCAGRRGWDRGARGVAASASCPHWSPGRSRARPALDPGP